MTIASGAARKAGPYLGDGIATVFAFGFKTIAAGDLSVTQRTTASGAQVLLVLNTDYTVALNADQNANPGGTVTTIGALSPMPNTKTLTISGNAMANTQGTHLTTPGPWNPGDVEQMADRAMIAVQELQDRAVKFPVIDGVAPVDLPQAEVRANRLLGFDITGAFATYIVQAGTSLVDLAASTGSTLVGFIQAGAGAVARTLQSRLRDTVHISDFSVDKTFAVDSTAGIQAALTSASKICFQPGNYKLTAALSVAAFQQLVGDGCAQFVQAVAPSGANISGVRLIQTGAVPAVTFGNPATSPNYAGMIRISDMLVQGVNNVTVNGTHGIFCSGSQAFRGERIRSSFFLNSGFHMGATVDSILDNCIAEYSQDAGLDMVLEADFQPSSYNAYNLLVLGGQYNQCKNANIRFGQSAFGVKIIGADIESAGSFYPGGTGYGVDVPGQAEACGIYQSWIEGNVLGINLGPTNISSTVPRNFVIQGNKFGTVTGPHTIRLRSGRGTTIRNNFFPDGALIFLDPYTDNPILEGNRGQYKLTNASGETIPYNNMDPVNDFPQPDLTNASWSKANCVIAQDLTVVSPGGKIAVYKITPSSGALFSFTFVGSGLSPYTGGNHHTFGFWVKSNSSVRRKFGWQLSTSGGPTTYSSYDTSDQEVFADGWQWVSFGRSIPSTDTGNFQLALVSPDNAGVVDMWITAMQSKPGIINAPFPPLRDGDKGIKQVVAANYTVLNVDSGIKANFAGIVTLTLESAALNPGKRLLVHTLTNNTVVSAGNNVEPILGGAAGTAILAATAGKWAILQSDGINWQIVASN